MKHQETHPSLDVEGCFACRISHIRLSCAALPTRSKSSHLPGKEKLLDKDLEAYKRIRRTGGQPTQIDGSARIEATA